MASQTNPSFNTTTTITFSDSLFAANAQLYNYEYQITSTGQQGNSGKRVVVSSGVLRLSVGRGSFADYMMFTNVHTMPSGSAIWFTSSGNFEGRVHTNGEFRFQGRPTFQDLVTSVNAKAWYYTQQQERRHDRAERRPQRHDRRAQLLRRLPAQPAAHRSAHELVQPAERGAGRRSAGHDAAEQRDDP